MQLNGTGPNRYLNLRDCVKKIYKNHGIKGFYQGLLVNIIKCIPGAAIQFTVYEKCKNYGFFWYFNGL